MCSPECWKFDLCVDFVKQSVLYACSLNTPFRSKICNMKAVFSLLVFFCLFKALFTSKLLI